MKVGVITTINEKGQIVIPKQIRESLGVDTSLALNVILRGGGIYIYPIEEVITKIERDSIYLKILIKTQGAWAEENWGSLRKKRKKIELAASRRRKIW